MAAPVGLQFSDTANKQGLIQDCEFNTGLGDSGISGNSSLLAHFTRLINEELHRCITMILRSEDEWRFDDASITTTYPIATRAMVSNQQDYKFTTASWTLIAPEGGSNVASQTLTSAAGISGPLRIDRVDVTFDNTNWSRASPFDISETNWPVDTTSIGNNFTVNTPFYSVFNGALWLWPIPNTTTMPSGNGTIKIWFTRDATLFQTSDTTKYPPLDPLFHRMLSVAASYDYALSKGLTPAVTQGLGSKLKEMSDLFMDYYGMKQSDRRMVMKPYYQSYK